MKPSVRQTCNANGVLKCGQVDPRGKGSQKELAIFGGGKISQRECGTIYHCFMLHH